MLLAEIASGSWLSDLIVDFLKIFDVKPAIGAKPVLILTGIIGAYLYGRTRLDGTSVLKRFIPGKHQSSILINYADFFLTVPFALIITVLIATPNDEKSSIIAGLTYMATIELLFERKKEETEVREVPTTETVEDKVPDKKKEA